MSMTKQDNIEHRLTDVESELVVDTSSDHSSVGQAVSSTDNLTSDKVDKCCAQPEKITSSSTLSCSDDSVDSNDQSWGCSTPDADDSNSSSSIVVDGDDDCVIIGTVFCKHSNARKNVSFIDTFKGTENGDIKTFLNDNSQSLKSLQNQTSLEPRRNPKRQAKQLNYRKKRFESMFEFCSTTPKDEEQQRRSSRRLRKLQRSSQHRSISSGGGHMKKYCVISCTREMQDPPRKKSRPHCTVNTRSATRRMWAEGCVLVEPAAEDEWELRTWPVEGMHERPVWPDPRYLLPEDTDATAPRRRATQLERAAHETLHAVLAFCAQACMSGRHEVSLDLSGAGDNCQPNVNNFKQTLLIQHLVTNFNSDVKDGNEIEDCNTRSDASDIVKSVFSSRIREIALECSNILAPSNSPHNLKPYLQTGGLGSGDHLVNSEAATVHVSDNAPRAHTTLPVIENAQSNSTFCESSSNCKNIFETFMGTGDGDIGLQVISPMDLTNPDQGEGRTSPKCGGLFKAFSTPLDLSTLPVREESNAAFQNMPLVSLCPISSNINIEDNNDRPIDLSNMSKLKEPRDVCPSNEGPVDLTIMPELKTNMSDLNMNVSWRKEHVCKYEREIPLDLTSTQGQDGCVKGDAAQGEVFPNREALQDLIHSTLLLYCTVCSVSQKALAEYIDSLTVASLLEWLQESTSDSV